MFPDHLGNQLKNVPLWFFSIFMWQKLPKAKISALKLDFFDLISLF